MKSLIDVVANYRDKMTYGKDYIIGTESGFHVLL